MNVDRYTKAVLTVIAGCLLWICAMGAGGAAQAQQTTRDLAAFPDRLQPVVIVGTGSMDVQGKIVLNFTQQAGGQRTDPTVPVQLPYTAASPMPSQLFYTSAVPLPVEIAAVKKTGEWEPLRAKVEDGPTRPRPGGGQR
jgi:Ni,Fe-hydrogenase III small subunit